MSTLFTAGNPGIWAGRCDAKCYDAEQPACECICGGRNHGVGESTATENTKEHYKEIMDELQKKKMQELEFIFSNKVAQLVMF